MNRINHSSRFIEECYSRYPKQKLGGHISVIRGVSYKPSDVRSSVDEGVVIILRSNNIADGEINFDDLVYVVHKRVQNEQKLKPGDIVMCGSNGSIGLVGKAGLLKDNMPNTAFGAFCLGIKCKETILPEYLNTYFNTQVYRNEIESMGNGTNIINIRPDNITNLSIPIPSVEKQMAFVEVVNQADKSKFNGFKSRFIEMFSSEPKMSLSEVSKITMGSSPDSKYYNLEKQGLPFYQGKTEFGDMYIGEASVYCKEPVRIAEPGDILMSVRAPVGTVNFNVIECCIGRGLASIRPKRIIEPLYLFYALRLKEAYIDALGTGSTFKAINKDSLFSFKIEVGDKAQQNEFVHFAEQADKSKYLN